MLSYSARAKSVKNPVAKSLLALMDMKKSNLCVSADLTRKDQLLNLADTIGAEICMLKTHIDIIDDFDGDFIKQLTAIAEAKQFILFEDRKFADIGHTVKAQYSGGIYRIADWAKLVTVHSLPGVGIIDGLAAVGQSRGNAALLLAEMSSQGHLMDAAYRDATLELAKARPDFVIGFIAQRRITPDPDFLHFMPGIHLSAHGDNLGQQYTSPQQAISEQGADVIIVGRGIVAATSPLQAAQTYRKAGWDAYCLRLGQQGVA